MTQLDNLSEGRQGKYWLEGIQWCWNEMKKSWRQCSVPPGNSSQCVTSQSSPDTPCWRPSPPSPYRLQAGNETQQQTYIRNIQDLNASKTWGILCILCVSWAKLVHSRFLPISTLSLVSPRCLQQKPSSGHPLCAGCSVCRCSQSRSAPLASPGGQPIDQGSPRSWQSAPDPLEFSQEPAALSWDTTRQNRSGCLESKKTFYVEFFYNIL